MAKPTPVKLREMSSADLVRQLEQHPGWHADRARMILAERRDPAVIPDLQKKTLAEQDPLRTLQYLWALHVGGGLTDDIARQLLDHPAASVRRWSVRLIGDARRTSPATGERLIKLAEQEGDITVRCQLAATARRLPAVSLPILENLLHRTPDQVDPYLSLMIWWGLESQAISQRPTTIERLSRLENYSQPAFQFQLEKLARRYGAEGTRAGYDACAVLLQDGKCPPSFNEKLEAALRQGLAERAQELPGIGQGDFLAAFGTQVETADRKPALKSAEPVSGPLFEIIQKRFHQKSRSLEIDKVALLTGNADLKQEFLKRVSQGDAATRRTMLAILETFGDADCVSLVLPMLDTELRLTALRVLARFDHPDIVPRVIALYSTLKGDELRAAQDLCLRRTPGTLALLKLVDEKRVAAADLPLDQLRLVALHGNEQLNALVRKHWGNLQPGTSEEKLATVRRFKNDLRAAGGNATQGKVLYTKHCATCHKLFDEGGLVGPNLTPANRGDRDFLLVSIVDPNAVIRSQFLNYVVTTQSGSVMQGVIAEQDGASVTLVDAKGQRHQVARAEIEEMKESAASLMPEKLLEQLSPQELRDLFAYLQGQAPQVAK
ncbi:MAG: Cytochrome c [Planctomycetaceae bacterium]|nr:Cytochrome c [Planctomycetaceae bacterium]